MALTPDSTWTAEANKVNSRPVYLANLEYDYLRAGVTYASEFQSGTGTADKTAKPGKVVLQKNKGTFLGTAGSFSRYSGTDVINSSSYSDTNAISFSNTVVSNETFGGIGVRFKTTQRFNLRSIKFSAKVASGSSIMTCTIHEVQDDVESAVSPKKEFSISDHLTIYNANGLSSTFVLTNAYQDFQLYFMRETIDGEYTNYLEAGTYVIMFYMQVPTDDTVYFKTWYPNTTIFNAEAGYAGFRSPALQMGTFKFLYGYATGNFMEDKPNINYILNTATFTNANFFDGYLILDEFLADPYENSTYTTPWMQVKNSSGTGTTPTANGQVRLDYTKPLNTDITFVLWWATDSSGTGATSLGAVTDGATISTLKDYYQIVCTMTTTDWFSTPEISSLSCYFKLTNDYCKFDDAFTMADGSPARPYVDSIPSYETRVDPINNKVSFNEPAIDLIIQKKGFSKTASDIETLIQTYFMTGKELSIKVGYNGVASTYFLNYQTGVTNNQVWDGDNIYRLECKDPYFQTKDPFLIDEASTFQPFFSYDNPIDIMLTLVSLSGISQRLIDASSFSSIKSSYLTSWQFFRPYDEPIKDIKKELDEIALLTGAVAVTKEDGKIYCVKLDSAAGTVAKKSTDSQTFNDQNSKAVGKANIDLSKRVNVCSVQRGYWIEPSDQQSKDVEYWETEIDEESILNVGRSEVLKIENKWIPKDTTIGGIALAKIVAQRIVARFRYGLWTLKRSTDLSFAFIQVGDQVTILGSQVLYKNFYGENSYRGVIIGKEIKPSAKEYEGEIIWTIWVYQNISATLEPEPTAQGTSLVFSAVDDNEITLTWTAASPSVTGYVALFSTGQYPNTLPEDGVQYTAGDVVNDATVAYRNTGVTFTHSSLSSDTRYFYKIFSYNDSGTAASTNFNKIAPLQGSRWTMATAPGANPTTIVFGAFSSDSNTTLTWTDSVTSPLAQAHLVLRSTAATPDTAPTDGTGYAVGDTLGNATVVYNGTAAGSTGFTDTGIAFTGITYYYAIYAFRGSDSTSYNYTATALTGNKASTVAEPTAQATGFSGESTTTTEMALAWGAASPAVTGYVVGHRKASSSTGVPVDNTTYTVGGAPFGDMTISYAGTGTSATVTGLTAGQYYIFKIFAYNGSAGSENYLTTSPPSFYDIVS